MKSKYRNRTAVIRTAWLICLMAAPAIAQDSAQQRFDDAVQAIEADRLHTARRTLEDLLAEHPNLQRVRLELARVNYMSYDYDEAERLARQVLDDPNTPPTVQTTVLAFLAQIREDRKRMTNRHSLTPSIYVGMLYDSNVNFGPSRDIIEINGIPLQIAPESQETDDWAVVINPAIAHTYNPGKTFNAGENSGFFVWQSLASAYYRGYFTENDFDFGVLTLRTGPEWIVPRHWRAGIGLQGEQIWLGSDSLAWFSSLNPYVTWALGEDTDLTLDAYVTQRNYWRDRDEGRDGWYQWAGLSVDQFFNNDKVTLNGGIGYANFDADDNQFSYLGPEIHLGGVINAWQDGSVYASVRYKNYDFKGAEPGFSQSRDDDEYRYTLGTQHNFRSGAMHGWSVLGSLAYTDNQSDIPIYDYDRLEVNFGLQRVF